MPCQSIVVPRLGFLLFGFQTADRKERQALILQVFEDWGQAFGTPSDDVQVVLTYPGGTAIESTQGWGFLREWAALAEGVVGVEFRLTPGIPVDPPPAVPLVLPSERAPQSRYEREDVV